ncbi:lipocalin family protein [Winogradskyella sp. DF17]|uniref:Lipocalin family protein n=1 Tax=Winogradskyella pelagia TaxID=2819984 RepID=A0ABS3T0V6_9FLAO|nr:lipocalin family protein [Winogradskyella sp. DF17]MBO3116372.1 lipocalin family protein [Winogradskyella sp. DF17]
MSKVSFVLGFLLLVFVFSCDKDDDNSNGTLAFYNGALTSVTQNDLLGTWAIFNIEYENDIFDVPINYSDCGRDFLVFSENAVYTEYLFLGSDCSYEVNTLSWELNNGVITLSNQFQQSEDLVVTSFSNDQFSFKGRLDIDDDGVLDIVTFYLQRYIPIEIDTVTPTFIRNQDEAFENLISFTWQPYNGFNQFDRYEIYRSFGDNCSIANAQLIYTSSNIEVTEFTDLNPDTEQYLCYYLRVYTDQGLLGESFVQSVWTDNIYVEAVNLQQPQVVGTSIEFNWAQSTDPYFSHYELVYSNYDANITGSGKQVYTAVSIDDPENTSFTEENPPYLENPYYILYVHNIFGNKSPTGVANVTTYWQVPFMRDEIIGFQDIDFIAVDYEEPVVYFYGRESGSGFSKNIHRYNYLTKQTEAVANLEPQSSTAVPMKLIDSGFGKELIFEQANELFVYNAVTLEYKYTLNPSAGAGFISINDFTFSDNGYWILVDNDDVYTFTRDNMNFDLIDVQPHFPNHQGNYYYQVFSLNNDKLLVGHNNENNSYVYNLETDGSLVFEAIVPIPILDGWNHKTEYSASGDFIINYLENRLYSTQTFSLLESFGEPFFSSGLSIDGNRIFGTNNDPDWQVTTESNHIKEAIVYNRTTQQVSTSITIGYPHVIFENYNGDIISISSGLKKEDLEQNINNTADIFLEVVPFN